MEKCCKLVNYIIELSLSPSFYYLLTLFSSLEIKEACKNEQGNLMSKCWKHKSKLFKIVDLNPRDIKFLINSHTAVQFNSDQSLNFVRLFVTPWTSARLPVLHQLPEFTQTHVQWAGDAIQQSQPLSSAFPPARNLSQHQSLYKWVSSSDHKAKVLEFQLQHQSFQWTPRTDLFGWISLQSKGLSRVFSNTTVQKHQFISTQLSL